MACSTQRPNVSCCAHTLQVVFPVTARQAAHAVAAGALRDMANVADIAFRSVLGSVLGKPQPGGWAAEPALSGEASAKAAAGLPASQQSPAAPAALQQDAEEPAAQQQGQQPGEAAEGRLAVQPHQQPAPHQVVALSAGGWQGDEVVTGAVLTRIHKPMMEVSGLAADWLGSCALRCLSHVAGMMPVAGMARKLSPGGMQG